MTGIPVPREPLYRDMAALADINRIAEEQDLTRPRLATRRQMALAAEGLPTHGQKLSNAGYAGTREQAEAEARSTYRDMGLTYDEDLDDVVTAARYELAAKNPMLDATDAEALVLCLTGGEKDSVSQARALGELATWSPSQLGKLAVELSRPCGCYWCNGTPGHYEVLELAVSTAERTKFASSGVAMPGGHFPIPDAKHLAIAKMAWNQRNLAGQDAEKVKAHINKRAHALGLPGLDDGEHTGDRRGHESRRPRRGQHHNQNVPNGDTDFNSGGGDGGGGPSGGEGASMTMALSSSDPVDFYVALDAEVNRVPGSAFGAPRPGRTFEHEVSRDDTKRVDVDAAVAELTRNHPGFFAEKPHGSSERHAPVPPALKRLREQRALSGGRPQSWR